MEHLHDFKKGNLINYQLQSGDTSSKLVRIEEIENAEIGDRMFDLTLLSSGKALKFVESDQEARVSPYRLNSEILQKLGFKPFPTEKVWWDGLLEIIPAENFWIMKDGIPHLPDEGMKLRQKGAPHFLGVEGRDFEFHNIHELQNLYSHLKLPLNIEVLQE